MKSRPTKQKLKQRGILRERVFGCDLGEHLLNSGHDVPQVLKSCTEFIEKHGVVDGIYRLSGIASNIQKLRHEFDSEQIPDLTKDVYIQDIHCVGSLCKLYFRELPNPLLTYQLYEKFSEAVSAATDEERLIKIHDVIQQLPPPHYRTLEFLMRHLSRLAAFSYITNMHSKNLAIVWAPNLLRSKQIESACFSGTAAFMEVRIQSVVVEFILNHVDVLFSTKLSSLIREGAGHNSLSRPKSLLVSSPSTKLLTLEEAQARTQAQINSPVTEDSKYIEVGEGPAALQGKFHTVIEFPTERKRPPIKSKKSPVGSWRSFFNLGKSSSMSKRKLHRNPSEPNELKAMALAGGRGDTATLRSAKSEESLSSLHNVEGESKVYRPRRPRSSSDALSASFNGELLDSRQHCNSYDNLDATEDSDGDDGPICVPALISPPRSAGEDVDLSPPDIGMASLDFDPMSFQCSLPDTSYAFPLNDSPAGAEGSTLKRSPGSFCGKTNGSDFISATFLGSLTPPLLSTDFSRGAGEKVESKKLTTSYSYTDKPTQAVSPIKCGKTTSLTPFATSELFSTENPDKNTAGQAVSPQPLSPPSVAKDSPPLMGSVLLRAAEPSLSEAFQMELHSKLAAFDSVDSRELKGEDSVQQAPAASSQEHHGVIAPDSSKDLTPRSLSSTAPTTAPPPPPPPKNAARMLALALAESAQQVSNQSQSWSSEPPTPVSPLQPQEASNFQDSPHPLLPHFQTSEEERAGGESSPPPTSTATTVHLASSYPSTSSPTIKQQPLELTSTITKPSDSAKSSTTPPRTQPETDSTPPDTPLNKCAPLPSSTRKSPERQQPVTGQVPVRSSSSSTTPATTPSSSCKDTGVLPQPVPEVKPEETAPPPIFPKPSEQPPPKTRKPKKQAVSLPQHQTHTQIQPHLPTQPQSQTQPHPPSQPHTQSQTQVQPQPKTQPQLLSKASARVAPTSAEPVEKPWEAIKPVQPCTESTKYHDSYGTTPPAPPVRTIESKLATAALSQSEASYHILGEGPAPGHLEDALPHHPLSPRKSSTHQPAYLYHAKGESVLIEPPGSTYYHPRPVTVGPQSMPHHYRPDSVPPHLSFVSKSEPQIPYSARVDNRYSTLGPRSYHYSIKSRGNPRGVFVSPGPGHQGYSHDRTHGYPTIRRVHSLHVPSTIRSVPIRSYSTNPSLALQDPAFSTSTNGLFSHHDPLLHLKSSQTVLPTALAFNHLPGPALSSALPVQSSTYRSAQESAPHLLQPQFSLLPSALPAPHGVPQPYGATVFSGSIERALQRECSVIKHHQRPSSSHAASEQLPNSEHSLQGYFGSGSEADVSYQQDPSRQTPVSTGADSSQGVNRAPQPKTDSVTQAYSSTSLPKAKDCSSKLAPHPAGGEESHEHSQNLTGGSPEHYSSPGQKQNSVIANQQSVQLSSLMSSSLSQTYITPHTQSQPSHSISDKLSPLYKTLPSLSSQSDNVASVSQTLVYSSSPGLSQEQEIQYGAQVQGLCQGNLSESYPASHSQGAPNVTFTSQSQGQASVTQSQNYTTGQSLNQSLNSYPPTCVRNLPTSNSTQDYTLMQASVGGKTHDALSQQQTQSHKYILSAPLPTYSSTAQALQNNVRSSIQDLKPTYGKQKLEELPIRGLDALQQASMEASAAASNMSAHNNVIYVFSKMDDHHKTQSVIRSNSRSDDQLMGLGHANTAQVKGERMGSLSQQHIHLSSTNGQGTANTKTTNSSIISSHVPLSSEQLKQHPLHLKSPEPHQQNHQNHSQSQSQTSAAHTQFITVPSTQVLLDHNQMILLQQPIVHHGQNTSKVVSVQGIQPAQDLGPVHVQYLQMDRELLGPSVTETQSQQGTVVSEQSSGCPDSSKHHYSQSANQQPNDAKNHFALNSICFPDSMLLADDRNILSNVDDILAATVAACGVTPQDFVKATSSAEAEMAVMASPVDSKGHFHTVDIRHMSPSFSSAQHSIITNTNSHTMTMTLNGAQMATDCQGQSIHHNSGSELDTNGDGGSSENGYHLAGQVYDPSGLQNRVKGNAKCIKTEDGLMECPGGEDFPKKKARSKSLTKPGGPEEDSGQARPAKRSGQAKRQNTRGSEVSSPSSSHSVYDGCPQQERMRQKIREVEEKQPEVKTGFIGSFLDFIKSGPKQQYSASPTRTISRQRKPCISSKPPPCTLPSLPPKLQTLPGPLIPQESQGANTQQKRLDEDLQKNLETLPSFSSDEEENTGKNQALRNSISSALSALDESSDRKIRADNQNPGSMIKPDQVPTMPHTVTETCLSQVVTPTQTANAFSGGTAFVAKEESKETPPGQLAVQLMSVAIEGLTDEELSDSGGEGMYRERDEFVVRNEDIEILKVTMRAGCEPPAIWKVQKALLQKFVPELRDGKRVFSATNSYLGYFGDAKTMYQRVYVKFLDTVNKREYVRVCSRKPRCKPMNSLRGVQVKTLLGLTATPSSVSQSQKPRLKQLKPRAEPPPKKRRKWKEEFSPTASGSSAEEGGEDDELNPPVPFASRFLNTRTMKETFKSFVELLISIALDEDVMTALERANDELLLPHMKRVDGMITDNRKRLLHKLHIGQVLKTALDSFPEISVVTELKKDGETPGFKVRLSGKAYNKKTMKPHKMPNKVPQEYTVDQQKTQWFSLYHSLQHYKYHTYLMCKDEIASLRVQAGDLGQEETVQKCLQNGAWVEGLFDRFGELINQVQQACR